MFSCHWMSQAGRELSEDSIPNLAVEPTATLDWVAAGSRLIFPIKISKGNLSEVERCGDPLYYPTPEEKIK